MNGLVPNRVALFADTVSAPNMVEAARRLTEEGYELVVIGPGAPAAAISLEHAGVAARAFPGTPAQVLEELGPAVAVSGPADAKVGLTIPNRVVLGASSEDPAVSAVSCFHSWVEDYLAPRVPRLPFKKARP